jgi:ubiquinone/menaquinone biosynthesis C-methylase UbiE
MHKLYDYYENYCEDNRLIRDNSHKVEFITTISLLDKIIRPNSKILDVGAGTGRYSFYFGEKG